MKNPLGIGNLGQYGEVLDPTERARVLRMNELVDEWNTKISQFEDPDDQREFVTDWNTRMKRLKSEDIRK